MIEFKYCLFEHTGFDYSVFGFSLLLAIRLDKAKNVYLQFGSREIVRGLQIKAFPLSYLLTTYQINVSVELFTAYKIFFVLVYSRLSDYLLLLFNKL